MEESYVGGQGPEGAVAPYMEWNNIWWSFQIVELSQKAADVLVFWCSGVMVFWCSDVMVFWCSGFLMLWCSDVLVFWWYGVLVFWCYGVLVFWCSGVLMFWCFWCYGVLVFWCSGVSDVLVFWCSDVMVFWFSDVLVFTTCSQDLTKFMKKKERSENRKQNLFLEFTTVQHPVTVTLHQTYSFGSRWIGRTNCFHSRSSPKSSTTWSQLERLCLRNWSSHRRTDISEDFRVTTQGVRQGCPPSPSLFTLYLDETIWVRLQKLKTSKYFRVNF